MNAINDSTGPHLSLDQVARLIGTTRQNVYQIERRALRKIAQH